MSPTRPTTHSQPAPAGTTDVGPPVIVVGLDGSPASWDAFSWAAGEAGRSGGRLVAVFVTPVVEPAVAMGTPLVYVASEQARAEVADQFRREAEQPAGGPRLPFTFVRQRGH